MKTKTTVLIALAMGSLLTSPVLAQSSPVPTSSAGALIQPRSATAAFGVALPVMAHSITLDAAITAALKVSPSVVQASGSMESAAAAQRSAVGAYLPSLSFNAGTGLTPSASQAASLGTLNAGLGASWDVFTAGRRGAQRERANAQRDSASANLSANRADVVLAVQRAFYDGLRAKELEQVAQARVKRAQEGLEAAKRRAALGSATQSDVLRGQLELNSAGQAVIEAQTAHQSASLALGRLVGIEGAVNALGGLPEDAPARMDSEALVAKLLQVSPDIRAAEASVVVAGAGVKVANAQYLPTLRLSAGYDWSGPGFDVAAGQTGWSVRLGLSFPIFDGFAREESAVNARVQRNNAASVLNDTRRAVKTIAEQALAQEQLAFQRINLGKQAVVVAEQDLVVQRERYALGASTILDLLTSQANVVQAQTDLVAARFNYQLARAEIEALSGRAS